MATTGAVLLLLQLLLALSGAALAGGQPSDVTAAARFDNSLADPDAEEGIRMLEADVPRLAERISIEDQVVRYRPVGLQANTQYEVRLSYPASNPVRVLLWIAPPSLRPASSGSAFGGRGRRSSSRKLLDAEKLLFSTDEFGKIRVDSFKSAEVDILFQAEHWAQHRGGRSAAPKTLVYDVVLEESILGVPVSAKPIAAWALLLVVASAAATPFWSGRVVPWLLAWLAQPDGLGGRLSRKLRTR